MIKNNYSLQKQGVISRTEYDRLMALAQKIEQMEAKAEYFSSLISAHQLLNWPCSRTVH